MNEIYSYSGDFPEAFEKEKQSILGAFKDCKVYHIGSTAVPGLGGKGIIDILITISDWSKERELVGKLKRLGFTHIHKREKERRFLSREPKDTGYKGVHIHIVKEDSKECKKIIAFRDYLISNLEEAKKYFDLKTKLKDKDSKEYQERKGEYIKEALKKSTF